MLLGCDLQIHHRGAKDSEQSNARFRLGISLRPAKEDAAIAMVLIDSNAIRQLSGTARALPSTAVDISRATREHSVPL
ncbi:hypothetical protein PHET_09960 [Paragonimus heterotremus]|uniref:Uncharacterized protein n=1 Tax=Paragonimus heterotremus TaxID=100268 RepID=A0A8J4WEM5_9TREM|nr:hypothetical protein PHET_09960 [Paragonimus heterotremus]